MGCFWDGTLHALWQLSTFFFFIFLFDILFGSFPSHDSYKPNRWDKPNVSASSGARTHVSPNLQQVHLFWALNLKKKKGNKVKKKKRAFWWGRQENGDILRSRFDNSLNAKYCQVLSRGLTGELWSSHLGIIYGYMVSRPGFWPSWGWVNSSQHPFINFISVLTSYDDSSWAWMMGTSSPL